MSVLEFYQEIIRDSYKLSQGAQIINNKLCTQENFGLDTFSLFLDPNVDQLTKHYIGILIKAPLLEIWKTNQFIEPQLNQIREMMLHSILQNTGDIRFTETISILTAEAIKLDSIQMWLEPMKELIKWFGSDHSTQGTDTSLELFCNLFSILDKLLNPLVQFIMPALFQKFAQPEVTEKQKEKLLVLLYLIITSFSHADGQNNQLVKMCFDDTYEIWMSLFLSGLNTTPKYNINIKRYMLKILIVIFRDFTYYSRKSIIQALHPIWNFFNKIIPLYCWNVCYDVPIEELDEKTLFPLNDNYLQRQYSQQQQKQQNQGTQQEQVRLDLDFRFLQNEEELDNDVEGLTLLAIELVGTLVTNKQLYMVIKFAVFPIINALSHLMQMTRQNERLWANDPNSFIAKDEDETNKRSLRNVAQKLMFELIETYSDQATQALMIVSEKFLLNLQEKKTVEMIDNLYKKLNLGDLKQYKGLDFNKEKLMQYVKNSNFDCNHVDNVWKKREVGLLLLGDFSDDIIYFTSKHQSSFDISILIKNLMQEIDDDQCIPILQSKALVTISRFSEIIGQTNKELFIPLFKVCTKCIDKNHQIPVRMTACKALGIMAVKLDRFKEQINNNNQYEQNQLFNNDILINLFDVLQYTSEDTLYIILDTLISLNKLHDGFARMTAEIGNKHILHIFTLFHSDVVIGKSIKELIQQLVANKEASDIILNTFTPFIIDCILLFNQSLQQNNDINLLKPSDLTLMGSIFEITGVFINNSQQSTQCEELMKLLQPLMNLLLINQDTSLQISCSLCLKNFIKITPQHIIKHNYVDEVKKVAVKLLEVPKDSSLEFNGQNAGNVIMLMFNNLLNGQVDNDILQKTVYKIFRTRMPSIVQSLVMVYARMINNNPSETVKFLSSFQIEQRMALKVLIDKWLLQMPVFRGKYTKNCAYMALIKLFLLKDQTLQSLLVLAYNPSHANVGNAVQAPYKIFSILIRGLDNEMAPSRKDKNLIRQAQDLIKHNNDDLYEDQRIDTDVDDGDDDMANQQFNNLDDDDNENTQKVDVDLEICDDDDDQENDIQRALEQGERKGGALGDLEQGSTNYITEGFQFGQFDDEGEGDENLEEDLLYLKDPCIQYETSDLLIKFFEDLAKSDPQYFQLCLKQLLKEDVEKLQKYIKFKNTKA